MKAALVFFLFLIAGDSFSQDITVNWIQNLDSTEFKLFYHKRELPRAFYRIQGIKTPNKIASAADSYSPGCTNPVRGQLNWGAKCGKNWVICVTRGSNAVSTIIYFLDYDTGKLRAYSTTEWSRRDITFGQIIQLLKTGENGLAELDPADFN